MLDEYLDEVLEDCYTIETKAMAELPMLLCQCHMICTAIQLTKMEGIKDGRKEDPCGKIG
jgi:hypothetical protein